MISFPHHIHTRCTPLDVSHPCFQLPGRNTLFTYPQYSDNQTMEITLMDIQFMVDNINRFADLIYINPYCATALKHLICLRAAPPCGYNSTDDLLPICAESCLAYALLEIHGNCKILYNQLHNGFDVPSIDLAGIINMFECSNPSSYYHFDNLSLIPDPQGCTDLLTEEQRGQRIFLCT